MKDWITTTEAAELTGKTYRGIRYHVNEARVDPKLFSMKKEFGAWLIETASFLPYLRVHSKTPLKCDEEV